MEGIQELPHGLLIETKLKRPSQYKKFLSKDEAVHGKEVIYTIEITNIGDGLFPGGTVELELESSTGMGSISTRTKPIEVPDLKPKDSFVLKAKDTRPIPGIWILTVEVKPKDKKKIKYYRSKDREPEEDWTNVYYVTDRHQLDVKIMLKELLKELLKERV